MATDQDSPRKRLNRDQKRALAAAEAQHFSDAYGRKSQKSREPNDRRYDRDVERKIASMPPETLDRLLRDDEE